MKKQSSMTLPKLKNSTATNTNDCEVYEISNKD
jgi:hypothetical protein